MAGLALLLPCVITLWISLFILNIFTKPFEGTVTHSLQLTPLFASYPASSLAFFSKILILIALILFTLLIGFLGRLFFINYFIRLADKIVHCIPLVNKIYKATQDVVHTVFQANSSTFSEVVLVPFPNTKSLAIGLITSKCTQSDNISVFVPGTPNPTMGFMVVFKREQLISLSISVEEAMKFVMSCGMVTDHDKKP